ncbi:MAG TPA: chemoreceptor glutamine deamidase CheD [Gammaproteobacteria bacterium]|nr:chemoreceptor glutamine deamidase CheD [Gammaproteobacteria bacterium]
MGSAVEKLRQRNLGTRELSPALPGFDHINRYWDRHHATIAAKILPGEYYVTTADEVVVTVLGSCVSACVRDPLFGIGGMNHFMLPDGAQATTSISASDLSAATRYGNVAMEHLINGLIKHGGRREFLEVKIVGGGQVIDGMTDVGARNISFVRDYLSVEGMAISGEDVGGGFPRKVYYNPRTGKVKVKLLKTSHNDTLVERESAYRQQLTTKPEAGDVELF